MDKNWNSAGVSWACHWQTYLKAENLHGPPRPRTSVNLLYLGLPAVESLLERSLFSQYPHHGEMTPQKLLDGGGYGGQRKSETSSFLPYLSSVRYQDLPADHGGVFKVWALSEWRKPNQAST